MSDVNVLEVQEWYRPPLSPCRVWWGWDFECRQVGGKKVRCFFYWQHDLSAALVFQLLGMILKFLPHRVDKLYRWGWDLLWRSRFFHTNFHLISIRVGAWGHKTKNFMQFRNINAPQGRVHWVVYKIFRVCEECHIRSHIKTRADSLWEFRVASYGCIFPKVLAPTGSKTIHQRR